MRTRYGVSPWIDTFPSTRRPDYPRLRGEHTADVVIVGGGLTGCATAYACAPRACSRSSSRPTASDWAAPGAVPGCCCRILVWPSETSSRRTGLRAARRVFEGYRKAALDGGGDAAAAEHPLRPPSL